MENTVEHEVKSRALVPLEVYDLPFGVFLDFYSFVKLYHEVLIDLLSEDLEEVDCLEIDIQNFKLL